MRIAYNLVSELNKTEGLCFDIKYGYVNLNVLKTNQ